MAKKKNHNRFVFNDETVKNSYGFIIPTEGISLERFMANPVMLDGHWNSTYSVIGRWENVQSKKGILSGKPVFDSDDEHAARIEGKVERDFIKSCSMGITFDPNDLKYVANQLILEKCELYEVSIVAVPSNRNSITLYTKEGEVITEEQAQQLCLSAMSLPSEKETPSTTKNPKIQNMKVTLTNAAALALGLGATTEIDAAELSAKVVALEASKKAAELKLSGFLQEQETAKLSAVTQQVDLAIQEGRIAADKKDDFVNLGIANPDLLTSTLESFPKKASLAAQVTSSGETEVKTVEDFQKLGLQAQLEFKATQPEAYKQLFTPKTK